MKEKQNYQWKYWPLLALFTVVLILSGSQLAKAETAPIKSLNNGQEVSAGVVPQDQKADQNKKPAYISGSKLAEDTSFEYLPGKTILCQKGSVVELFKSGMVKKARLAQSQDFKLASGQVAGLAANSEVEFSESGSLFHGVLAKAMELEYIAGQTVNVKATAVAFNQQGYIREGVLAQDEELRFQDGVRMLFQKDTFIAFRDNGNVHRGSPSRMAFLKYNADILTAPTQLQNTDGNSANFKAGSEVTFYPGGLVEKGILDQDCSLAYSYNQYLIFQKDSEVSFAADGYINEGIVRDNQYLPYKDDKCIDISAATKIIFEAGKLKEATLMNDSELKYRSDKPLLFLAGSRVSFNNEGYVCAGTLQGSSKIEYNQNWQVLILGGQPIEFYPSGYLKSGVLGDSFSNSYATYREHSRIEFDAQGQVIYGTLRDSARLPRGTDQWVVCQAGSEVYYHPNYNVKEATLNGQEKLPFSYEKTNSNVVILSGATKVSFTDQGFVSRGSLFQDTFLDYAQGKNAEFKAGSEVEFYTNGYVKTGVLKKAADFPSNRGEIYTAAANSHVFFNSQGLLERVEY